MKASMRAANLLCLDLGGYTELYGAEGASCPLLRHRGLEPLVKRLRAFVRRSQRLDGSVMVAGRSWSGDRVPSRRPRPAGLVMPRSALPLSTEHGLRSLYSWVVGPTNRRSGRPECQGVSLSMALARGGNSG